MDTSKLDKFTRAYLACALWTGTDESDESWGEPLDLNYSIEDFASKALERAVKDCAEFQQATTTRTMGRDRANGPTMSWPVMIFG